MAANAIQVEGYITESGELKVTLPKDHPVGSVKVTIEPAAEGESPWEERPWTEEELQKFLDFKSLPLGEILASGVVGAWSDMDIGDSAEWVEKMRRAEEEHHSDR